MVQLFYDAKSKRYNYRLSQHEYDYFIVGRRQMRKKYVNINCLLRPNSLYSGYIFLV